MTAPFVDSSDRPDTPCQAYKAAEEAVTICRDVAAGTLRLRDACADYLPQAPGEQSPDYADRVRRSTLFNGLGRTVKGLAGMVMRKDIVLEDDVPEVIAGDRDQRNAGGHWENIDLRGTHGDVFARNVLEDALEVGFAGILVEMPDVSARPPASLKQERQMGLRPYWCKLRREDVISWREESVNGSLVLTQLVVREMRFEPKGQFGEEKVTRYRVYVRGPMGVVSYSVYRMEVDQPKEEVSPRAMTNLDRIPVAWVHGRPPVGLVACALPLLDLALINLQHFQTQSDYARGMHMALIPTLVLKGRGRGKDGKYESVVIGPNAAIDVPTEGDAKYIEHSGSAFGAAREYLKDLEGQMASLGLSMLQRETRAAETAEAKRIDKAEGDAPLAVVARALQDAIENALMLHAKFLKLPEGGSVTVNRDFEGDTMTPQEIDQWSQLVERRQITLDTMYAILKAGGALPPDFDGDAEQREIELAMPEPEPVVEPEKQPVAA